MFFPFVLKVPTNSALQTRRAAAGDFQREFAPGFRREAANNTLFPHSRIVYGAGEIDSREKSCP